MAAVVARRVRTSQPQQNPQIDWSNPITAGLVFAYCLGNEAQGFAEDGRNGVPYVKVTDPTVIYGARVNTPTGTGAQAFGSAGYICTAVQSSVKAGNYSLFAFGTGPATGTQSAIDDDDSATRRFQFRLSGGKVEFIPFYSGGNGDVIAPTALSAGDLANGFAMGATVNGTTYAVYQKGMKTSATLGGAALTPNSNIYIGARKANATNNWTSGSLMLVAMWNRPLTDAEHASLSDNPWQMFKASPRRLWMPRAAISYVMQAAAGVFSLAASQAAVLASRRLVAVAGALTFGSSPAQLITSRRLMPDSGAFALTGASAVMLASRRLIGAAGAFTMTGSAASIAAARKLAANVGTFGLMGSAVPITVSRRLLAQSGAFVLSPGSVQMVYTPIGGPSGPTYTLTAVVGAFDLTGGAAMLQASRRLLATAGVFGWDGSAAGLLVGRRLPAATSVFFMASAVAAARVARRMPAEAGEFDLVGADAQLRYSAQVVYSRAPVGPGYTPRQHYNDSRPATPSAPRPAALQRNNR